MNAENRDDYVIEDDGVHWYSLDEDISNESFEYDNPEPEGLSRILLSHPEINLSAVARRLGIRQSLLAAYSSGMKHPSEARADMIVREIHKIGAELISAGAAPSAPVSGYGAVSTVGSLRDENAAPLCAGNTVTEKSLTALLRSSLHRSGMAQKELAEKMSVSQSRINAYMSGRAIPTLKMAARLCRILSIPPSAMLSTVM